MPGLRYFTVALLLTAVTSCDYYKAKGMGQPIVVKPDAPVERLEPTFSSIQRKILLAKCVDCHSPRGEGRNVPLNTLDDLLDSPRELVLPGNVEESGLMISLLRADDKRMPPPKTGGPLSDEEIGVIRLWIAEGAKP